MANTLELIASSTVGAGGASAFDFTSIPSTYTDLVVKLSSRTTNAADWVEYTMAYNGTSASGSWRAVFGTGSSASSTTNASTAYAGESAGTNFTASTFASSDIYIPNYTSTASSKSFSTDSVTENNATTSIAIMVAGLMTGASAAINRLYIATTGGNFAQYSTAYLYGVKNA